MLEHHLPPPGLAHQAFRTKFGGLEIFLKFKLSLARALSSETTFELAALILNYASLLYQMYTIHLIF